MTKLGTNYSRVAWQIRPCEYGNSGMAGAKAGTHGAGIFMAARGGWRTVIASGVAFRLVRSGLCESSTGIAPMTVPRGLGRAILVKVSEGGLTGAKRRL